MTKAPWQVAIRLIVLFASLTAFVTVSCLIYAAFGESIANSPPNKGPVPEWTSREVETIEYQDGIHLASGLAAGKGLAEVRANCTNCHSAKLITQNRMTRDGWRQSIIWMQQTQGLWDLGEYQGIILDYLAENYAPQDSGRRRQLTLSESDWYKLDLD